MLFHLGLELQVNKPPCGCCGPNQRPLEEQGLLLCWVSSPAHEVDLSHCICVSQVDQLSSSSGLFVDPLGLST